MVPKFDRAGADDDPATGKEQLRGSENEAVVGVGTVRRKLGVSVYLQKEACSSPGSLPK